MRRGFTLLEVIVAVSLVLALGALVVPAVSRRVAGATGESVSRELRAAVSQARGDAVRESRTLRVEIVTDPVSGSVRMVARPFVAEAGAEPARFVGPIFDEAEIEAVEGGHEADREVMELPRWTRVSREAPVAEEGLVEAAGEGSVDEFGSAGFGAMDSSEAVCIGVLLPTGGAVAGAPVYLALPGSWTLVVSLDAWAGDAAVTRWEPPVMEDAWDQGEGEMSGR